MKTKIQRKCMQVGGGVWLGSTWGGNKMSKSLIVGDEDKVGTKLHVLDVLATLLFQLDLGIK